MENYHVARINSVDNKGIEFPLSSILNMARELGGRKGWGWGNIGREWERGSMGQK